jgi:uncharacterized membrane protein YdjX (TVP38/TMEM64 family)
VDAVKAGARGRGRGRAPWGRAALLALLVVGGALLARGLGLDEHLRLEALGRLRAAIEAQGALAPALFIAGYVLAVVFFVPGLPITILGGIAFGAVWGTIYVSFASTVGAALAFLVARHALRGAVAGWVAAHPRLRRIDEGVARHGWRIVMITRLVPLFPFNLQNYAYGLTRVGFRAYVVTSWICMLPATAAYTVAGGALSEGGGDLRRTLAFLAAAGALIVLVSLLPRWLGRSRAAGELLRAALPTIALAAAAGVVPAP